MTKVIRESTAFIIIDAQNFVLHEKGLQAGGGIYEFACRNNMIQKTALTIEKLRAENILIIFMKMDLRPQILHLINKKLPDADFWKPLKEMDIAKVTPEEGEFQLSIVAKLTPQPEDLIITKYNNTMNGFHNTDLDRILRALNCDTLVFAGAVTNLCVESTVRGAFDRGYNCIVLSDCVAALNEESQRFATDVVFPLLGKVCSSDELEIV